VILDDLAEFAALEDQGGDIEPWAAVISQLHVAGTLDREQAGWLATLYNTTDNLGSAWRIMRLWPDPRTHAPAAARELAPRLPLSGERRNLYGGRILRRFDSYTGHLDGAAQLDWVGRGLAGDDPYDNFAPLLDRLRRIWGVGRLAAFEWAEFWHKVCAVPVDAPHGELWESSGPRASLCNIYGNAHPTRSWLDDTARGCREHLREAGVALSWWDFETVICDFNVMVGGRYYPGQHIAMIREEIEGLDGDDRQLLRGALTAAVPAPWCDIPPAVSKPARSHYRRTGRIPLPAQLTQGAS
jgi:hypothetical protein